MKPSQMYGLVAGCALLAAGAATNGQVTFYTGATQIVNSDGQLPFSDITQNGQSLVNYQSAGLTVNINNIAFIFTPCGFNNPNIYYPNTGTLDRIEITRNDGRNFDILEMQISHGFGGCTMPVWATAYLGNQVVAHFDVDVSGGTLLGCRGTFDRMRIGSYADGATRDTHNESAHNAIALDNMEYGRGGGGGYTLNLSGPCPGSKRLAWSGATPSVQQGIVFGNNLGNTTIPTGPCLGTVLGVSGNVHLVNVIGTGSGSGSVNGNAGTGACGHFLQLIEAGSCNTSNTAPI